MNSSIHPETRIDSVHLKVSDLHRSIQFYTEMIGFHVIKQEEGKAWLAAGTEPILVLYEVRDAIPKKRTTGLYHFAILVPDRQFLGQFLNNLARRQYPLEGASDHLVSEALYLSDPDGNGIEVYADRPSDTWSFNEKGELQMATGPLALQALLDAYGHLDWEGLPEGTTIGHIHLHVADLSQAKAFYCGILGFDLMAAYGSQALFVAAGGYHHHIGLNTWAGSGAPEPQANSVGLKYFSIVVPDDKQLSKLSDRLHAESISIDWLGNSYKVKDPSGNVLLIAAEGESQ